MGIFNRCQYRLILIIFRLKVYSFSPFVYVIIINKSVYLVHMKIDFGTSFIFLFESVYRIMSVSRF